MAIIKGLLQPAAPGLLSALQLKQRGANPDTLSDTVVPTVDLTHWYLANQPSVQSGVFELGVGVLYGQYVTLEDPSVGPLTVPDNEIWWVRSHTVSVVIPNTAVTFAFFQLKPMLLLRELSPGDGFRGMYMGENAFGSTLRSDDVGAIPDGFEVLAPSLRDFWAPPGAQFGAQYMGAFTGSDPGLIVGRVVCDRLLI